MNERLIKLSAQFASTIDVQPAFRDETSWKVGKENLVELATALRNHPETPFAILIDVTAVDFTSANGTIEMVYHLASHNDNVVLRLKVALAADDPTIPTLSHIWRSADWLEREVYDLFGVRFSNHPDLRRIVMPDDYPGHPLLKEHPLCPQEDCDDF